MTQMFFGSPNVHHAVSDGAAEVDCGGSAGLSSADWGQVNCPACVSTPVRWSHIPGLVERDAYPDQTPEQALDHHNLNAKGDGRSCFGCWCYSCGGRTDQPRLRGVDEREGLDDPDSHRWCFE